MTTIVVAEDSAKRTGASKASHLGEMLGRWCHFDDDSGLPRVLSTLLIARLSYQGSVQWGRPDITTNSKRKQFGRSWKRSIRSQRSRNEWECLRSRALPADTKLQLGPQTRSQRVRSTLGWKPLS